MAQDRLRIADFSTGTIVIHSTSAAFIEAFDSDAACRKGKEQMKVAIRIFR
jgi:hypothetical protein